MSQNTTQDARQRQSVTIVGAGVAGLTAAYALTKRGYSVRVLEQQSVAGGNLAGYKTANGIVEVYPHMFGAWYDNFWALMQEIGVVRNEVFEPRPICAFIRQGDFPKTFHRLEDNGALRTAIKNLFSGIMPVADMFLAAYAIIDLLTQDFSSDDLISQQTVNGFLVTRPYATERMAAFFEALVLNIWSVDSYRTSAYAYQNFAKFQFRRPSPQCWVVKTNSRETIIAPLEAALKKTNLYDLEKKRRLGGVTVNALEKRVTKIWIAPTDEEAGMFEFSEEQVDNLILAITPTALPEILMNEKPHRPDRDGSTPKPEQDPLQQLFLAQSAIAEAQVASLQATGATQPFSIGDDATAQRQKEIEEQTNAALKQKDDAINQIIGEVPITAILPELATTRRLTTAPIPVVYVAFNEQIIGIPNDYVALVDSRYSLTFVKCQDLTAKNNGNPVLAVGASNFEQLPVDIHTLSTVDDLPAPTPAQRDAAFLILTEFQKYVPFPLGRFWGDTNSIVDWKKTCIVSGVGQELFLNEVGSRDGVPQTTYSDIKNLYFAGENRENPVTIATVEAAVASGLQAAKAFFLRQGDQASAASINVITPQTYSQPALLAWKVGLAPYAAMAKCWSLADDVRRGLVLNRRDLVDSRDGGLRKVAVQVVSAGANVYTEAWSAFGSALGQVARGLTTRR